MWATVRIDFDFIDFDLGFDLGFDLDFDLDFEGAFFNSQWVL